MAASKACLLDVSDEILLLIFSYLSHDDLLFGVKPTCDRFHQLSMAPQLWRQIKIACFDLKGGRASLLSRSPEEFYQDVAHHKCFMRTQHLEGEEDIVQVKDVVTSVEERGFVWHAWPECSAAGGLFYSNLRRLTLSFGLSFALPPMDFLSRYSGLEHLELQFYFYDHPSTRHFLRKSSVVDIFENMKAMTNLRTLKIICLDDCFDFREPGDDAIRKSIKDFFQGGPELRHVHLECGFVNNDIFRTILDRGEQLEGLVLHSLDVTAQDFSATVSEKPRPLLSCLTIKHCAAFDDQCLRAMSLSFPNLKSLELTLTWKITDDGIKHLLGACPDLTSLNVTCPAYGEEKDTKSVSGRFLMKKLALGVNLHSLSLSLFDLTSTPQLYLPLHHLRTVDLELCQFWRSDITAMAECCPLLQTVTLKCYICEDTTALEVFMQAFPCLQTLNYGVSCWNSGKGDSLDEFAWLHQPGIQGTPSLRSLSLTVGVPVLASSDVLALTSLHPNLLCLEIRTPTLLSDDIIGRILRNCPRLQCLKLRSRLQTDRAELLTEACLGHILKWGTCLQSVTLVTRRSFSLGALVDTMLKSYSLTDFSVDHTMYAVDPIERMKEVQAIDLDRKNASVSVGYMPVEKGSPRIMENVHVFSRWRRGTRESDEEMPHPFSCPSYVMPHPFSCPS